MAPVFLEKDLQLGEDLVDGKSHGLAGRALSSTRHIP